MKVCLVASGGGHLAELYQLRDGYAHCRRSWVTFENSHSVSLLRDEHVTWAYQPTNRNILNLLRNLWLALRLLRRERPDAIVSTGAGVGVPFLWVGKLLGSRTIFIESITFSDRRSLSGRLVYPFVDHYFVQWPELAERFSKAEYRGQVL